MLTTYAGRKIEIIAPKNPYGACTYSVNGQGPREGERFTAHLGASVAAVLAGLQREIDVLDARGVEGITGSAGWTWLLRPGTWEVCPAPGLDTHIKPTSAPCNEAQCKRDASRKVAAAQRRAEKHPAQGAMVTRLVKAGFDRAGDGRESDGFRVHPGHLGEVAKDHRKGVTIAWYACGYLMPLGAHPGRCQEIADYLTEDGTYRVCYEGGARIRVVSKTHGVL